MSTFSLDTICAISTITGRSAVAVIRVSGADSITIVDKIFTPLKGGALKDTPGYRLRFGSISHNQRVIDEVIVSVYRTPHSYTGEDMVEISCHGSPYIQQEILTLLSSNGIRPAGPGEFSQRAFLNGKMDLAQAEAVADLIASETSAAHKIAMDQMKGGFSKELNQMRQSLLEIVSLMELELDFSDEDVEFADREKLDELLHQVIDHISALIESFKLGNVIKNGIPVAIAGATNTGKSTLLNALLGEERAIVSDIHGTTRDFIEGLLNIQGVAYRFIDTAGLRETAEKIEIIGIERTYSKIKEAMVVILMLDAERPEFFSQGIKQLTKTIDKSNQKIIVVINKTDTIYRLVEEKNGGKKTDNQQESIIKEFYDEVEQLCAGNQLEPVAIIPTAAKSHKGLEELKNALLQCREDSQHLNYPTLVTNVRHLHALKEGKNALLRVVEGMNDNLPTDLLAQDIRESIFHIGEIVGEINTEEILGNIFSKFCIGK